MKRFFSNRIFLFSGIFGLLCGLVLISVPANAAVAPALALQNTPVVATVPPPGSGVTAVVPNTGVVGPGGFALSGWTLVIILAVVLIVVLIALLARGNNKPIV